MIVGKICVGLTNVQKFTVYPLTEGLVGAEFEIEYTHPAWRQLSKLVTFRAGKEVKSVWDENGVVEIPWEVLKKAGKNLHVGITGTSVSNEIVVPTIQLSVDQPIQPSMEPGAESGADPTLPIWAQLDERMRKLEQPGGPIVPGEDGGYYTPNVTQPDTETVRFAFTPSKQDMPSVDPVDVNLPISDHSGGNANYNPVEKTEDMTQPVGVDTDGKLWVAPIGGSSGGNTGGTVVVQSKQLFDKENATMKTMYIGGSNGVIYSSAQDSHKTIFIPVDSSNNTAVTVHREVMLNRFVVATYTSEDPQVNDTGVNFVSDSTKTVKKLTVPIDKSIKTVGIFFYNKSAGDNAEDVQPYIDTLMVQYGTEFTGYEPYGTVTVPGESQPVVGETSQTKRYGVKWSTTDVDDLGERCFDAAGLSASIGIGATDGQSDFDNIYPWSEMKRCNIRTNAAGANIVTYEGDDGFALDGSNGDVFVKIPRFCVEKYTKDGYEYRVVSRNDGYLHPAFIENGKELDAIYVGAFEGYISDGKMHSIADVIPTNNEEPPVFLTAAQANGVCYTLYDMRCIDALWTLMAVEYGCRNSNQIIGYGYADFYQPVVNGCVSILSETGVNRVVTNAISNTTAAFMPIGSNITVCKGDQYTILTQAKLLSCVTENGQTVFTFDGEPIDTDTTCFIGSAPATTNFTETSNGALTWHTGRSEFVAGSTTRNPCRYRWVENPVGNVWHNTPDITVNNLQLYLCQDMTKYGIGKVDDGYIPVFDTLLDTDRDNGSKADVTGYNYWITSLQRDDFAMGISFGKSYSKELVSTKAFGAYFYTDDGLYTNVNGGGFDHLYRCNMLTNRAYTRLDQKWYLYGARLLYKRIV